MATSPAPPPCSWPSRSSSTRARLAESLRAGCCWHAGLRALGRGDRNRRPGLHQHPPQARGQAADRARGAGRPARAIGTPADRRPARDGRVRLGQPDRPAARGPRPAGRAGRRDLQPVRHPGLAGLPRVLLQRRRRADRHPGHQHAAARQGLQAGRRRLARAGLQRRLHRTTSPTTSWPRRPSSPTTASSPPRGDVERPGRHPPVRRGLPAPRAGPGPAGLFGQVRQLLPRIQPVHQRPGRGHGAAAEGRRQDLRAGRRAVAQVDRLRRRQGPRHAQRATARYTYFVPDVAYHIGQVGARLSPR